MEGDSRRWGKLSLQVSCVEVKGGRGGLVKGGMDDSACNLGRLFSSNVFFVFWWEGYGSVRLQIVRMCSSGREESRRACSTSLG